MVTWSLRLRLDLGLYALYPMSRNVTTKNVCACTCISSNYVSAYLSAIPLLCLHLGVNELIRWFHGISDRFVIAWDDVVQLEAKSH